VKKWDKETVGATIGAGLPECAFWRVQFSKTGLWLNSLFMRSMGGISTFQTRTTTATSIFLFFSCFLEAVASPMEIQAGSASHTTHLVSTKKSVALKAGSPLESSRPLKG
jgi:hypothetical protein